MSYRVMAGYAFVLAGVVAIGVGCPHTPPRILPSPINAQAAGEKAIELYDANKDGKLAGEELDKCPGLKAALPRVDPGNEGVTAAMITARIQAWQKTKLGRMPISCSVSLNGKPLEGAEVKFVPEKFLDLDDSKWTASGRTDSNGMAMLSIPTSGEREDPPGVPPGFYRVEVTKAGLNIPAKYNTETILGQEIASDADISRGIHFALSF